MLSTAGSVALKTRKGRTATVRPSTNLLNSSAIRNSTIDLRVQRLNALCGVDGSRAVLIAFLVWGEAQHG